jgi:hypothetical protein
MTTTAETTDEGPFTFTDTTGRAWAVEITTSTVLRVRTLASVDLMEAIEGSLVPKLVNDPMLLVNVLYCVLKPQADAAGVTDEQFGEALGRGKIWEARDCLARALIFFSPPEKRAAIRKVWSRTTDLTESAMSAVVKRLDDPKLDREVVAIVMAGHLPDTPHGKPSGNLPELSASTPDL